MLCDLHNEFLSTDSPLACKCARKPDHVFKGFLKRDLEIWEVRLLLEELIGNWRLGINFMRKIRYRKGTHVCERQSRYKDLF